MKTTAYVSKYLQIELDNLGVLLNTTIHKPKEYQTKVQAAINIPFEFKENKDFIRNTTRVYAERISTKISEVRYMKLEECSIKNSNDICVKVLILE